MTQRDRVLHYAQALSRIPNAPFLHRPSLDAILGMLAQLGVTPAARRAELQRGVYAIDDYCLYVRFARGRPARPILIDSHLDHPAFVLDGAGRGVALGSLGLDRLQKMLQSGPVGIRVFDPAGAPLGIHPITGFRHAGKPIIELAATRPIPANSHGLWDVPDFAVEGEMLHMHAADNIIASAVMLAALESVALNPADYPDIDVTFVFTFLEEIFEVSATALAMRRRTPFATIDSNHLILVLESMEAIPLAYRQQRKHRDHFAEKDLRRMRNADESWVLALRSAEPPPMAAEIAALYADLALLLPHPDRGVAIKINDMDCVYGYEYPDQPNLAETLMLRAAEELGLTCQHTLFGGACNGTAFSLFPTSSHIVTISAPNPFKHNIGPQGEVVPEQIALRDVDAMAALVRYALQAPASAIEHEHPRAVARRLKRSPLAPAPAIARRLRAERGSIAWSARWRLKHGRYFGATPAERAAFSMRGAASRVRQRLAR
jgi:hypothetical protein